MTSSTPPSPLQKKSDSTTDGGNTLSLGSAHKSKRVAVSRFVKKVFSHSSSSENPPQMIPTSKPHQAVQRTERTLSMRIFSENVTRVENIPLPKFGDRIEDTVQLVFCLGLLAKATAAAASLSPSPPSSPSTFSPTQLEWIQDMDNHPLEREHLRQLMGCMINKFVQHPTKDSEAIREIILLGPVLGEEQYRSLIKCFLAEFQHDTLLNIELLQGLVQLVQNASIGFLKSDDLTQILRTIRTRLQHPAQKLDEYSFHLTLAASKVLNSMFDDKVTGLDRIEEHEPLLMLLSSLRRREDPFLKYQALYAFQALQWVPNDETARQRGLRHFAGMMEGVIKISGAMQLDFRGFLGGLQDIQKAVEGTYGILKSGWEDVPALIENGKGVFDSVKEGLGSGHRHPWYITLRGAEALVRKGQFADFNELVSRAPCHRDPLFQWGICQLLGEIAVDHIWERDTRGQAINFLAEIYMNNAGSKQHQEARRWTLTILHQISELSDANLYSAANPSLNADNESVRTQIQSLIEDLKDDNKPFPYPYLLRGRLPLPRSSALLKDVNDNPDLDLVLDRLRRQQCNTYNKQAVYIQPLSKASLQATEDNLIPLHTRVRDFLKGKAKVMLILGDSGAGKSTFISRLEYDLWNKYEPGDPIPLYVDLKAIENPDKDMIQQQLDDLNVFSPWHIAELRSRSFILICDGYDERRKWSNLHDNNKFNKPSHWEAKMIITCRTQYLRPNYRIYLEPLTNRSASYNLYEEAVIAPFKPEQVEEYIEQYTPIHETRELIGNRQVWTAEQYLERLRGISGLMELVKNPLMLEIVLNTLPRIANTTTQMTRAELYDEFVEFLFEYEQDRLSKQSSKGKMESDISAAFASVEGDDFIILGIDFSMRLANSIFKEQGGKNSVEPPASTDERTWKTEFFGPDIMTRLMLESSPVVCRASFEQGARRLVHSRNRQTSKKNSYEFSHRSILEYFYSRLIYDPSCDPPYKTLSACSVSTTSPSSLLSHPLSQRNLAVEPLILDFLVERVQSSPEFKDHLQRAVLLSKSVPQASQAAANAITILVRAGVPFNGAHLEGIQIPGADLSGGQFDSAQLQGADLRNTNLRYSWLRQTNLSNAQMAGVQFGELPDLYEDDEIYSCAYSPDGEAFAIGLSNGTVSLYKTSTWEKIHALSGHTDWITSVVFSPSGQQIASSSRDKTIRLWVVQSGASGIILSDHTNEVTAVAFSPSGHQIASGSTDMTVRLWDVETGAPGIILSGHTADVTTVAFSPSGHQIASGSDDKTVQLWDAHTGAPGATLTGHTSIVTSVMFSPSGRQIASGSADETVRIWDTQTGNGAILEGHTDIIRSVAFSPNGRQIVSGSQDETVRLWDTETGILSAILSGHEDFVTSVAFSPDGCQVASSSDDCSVRLWDIQSSATGTVQNGHTDWITSVVFSPSGQQIASSSYDKTVRLWDVQTGAAGAVLNDHTKTVTSVAYSPSGHQIASGSDDKTVQLWDAHTGAPGATLTGHTNRVTSVMYSPSGHQIASSSWDNTVRIWDTQTGNGAILEGHTDIIRSVAFSPNGQQIASGSLDNTVRLWDAQSGARDAILSGHTGFVSSVVFSPSGQQIVSGSDDKTVRLWDAQSGAPCAILSGHTGSVYSVVFSPSGQQIASGSRDKTVRLWDAQTGAPGVILSSHTADVTTVAFSPSGHQIASGSDDHTVRLWDVQSGRGLAVVDGFRGSIESIAWNVSLGNSLITCSGDKSVRLWQVKAGKEHLVYLNWSSTSNQLNMSSTCIQNAQSLSKMDIKLMRQRGTCGTPLPPF